MFNVKYLAGAAALVLATSAIAGGPEQVPVAAPVADNSGFYINANGGLNLMTHNNNNNLRSPLNTYGFNGGAAVGYHFSNNIRLEVAGNYWRHNVRNNFNFPGFSAFQMTTVMGNAYYDFDFGSSFVPYLGAGIGWAHTWNTAPAATLQILNNGAFQPLERTVAVNNLHQNYLAVQGIAGLDYKITDNVRIGVSYHLVGLAGRNTNNNNQFRFSRNLENQFNIGLSYYF